MLSQLSNSEFSARGIPSFAPLCSPVPGTTLLNAFSDVICANPVLDGGAAEGADEEVATQKQLRRVLELMVVLWGDLPDECSSGKSGNGCIVTEGVM